MAPSPTARAAAEAPRITRMRVPRFAITLPPELAAAAVWLGRDITIRRWCPQQLGVGDWLALHSGQHSSPSAKRAALEQLGEQAVWTGRFEGWTVSRFVPDSQLYPGLKQGPRLLHLALWGQGCAAPADQPAHCSFSERFAPKPGGNKGLVALQPDQGGSWPGSWPIYPRAVVGLVQIGRVDQGSSCSAWDQGAETDAAIPAGGKPPRVQQRSLFAVPEAAVAPPAKTPSKPTGRRWVLQFDRILRLRVPLGGIGGHPRYWPLPAAYRPTVDLVEVAR